MPLDWTEIEVEFIAAGYDPAAFWHLTPRQIARYMKAARIKTERQYVLAMSAAWHTAALGRIKRMPKFEKFVSPKKQAAPQSSKSIQLSGLQLAAAWGVDPEQLKAATAKVNEE